jgi:hypothetical protein
MVFPASFLAGSHAELSRHVAVSSSCCFYLLSFKDFHNGAKRKSCLFTEGDKRCGSIVADLERHSIQRIGDVELGLICRPCVQLTTHGFPHGGWHHRFALVCEERVMVDDERWDI